MSNRMNIMIDRPRKFVLLAAIAAGLLPAATAHAGWHGWSYAEPAPLYHYGVQEERPYAVELAPNIYAVPYRLRAYPYVHCLDGCGRHVPVHSSRKPAVAEDHDVGKQAGRDHAKRRVIQADAEVTIVEPDRMIIRLIRRPPGPRAKAPADE
jgi:hypothetical protein